MAHKLLLADDSVTIQRVIELTFADEDIEVTAVGDGQMAIDRLDTDPPDIILADIDMPRRDGYEVAAYVKSRPKLAHIPVVLLTGAFEPIDEARAAAVGSSDVLAKPFEPQMVINRVKELLGKKRQDGQAAYASAAVTASHDTQPQMGDLQPAGREAGGTAQQSVSLDDYFDQLDAAFSNLQPGAPPSDGSEEVFWPIEVLETETAPIDTPPAMRENHATSVPTASVPLVAPTQATGVPAVFAPGAPQVTLGTPIAAVPPSAPVAPVAPPAVNTPAAPVGASTLNAATAPAVPAARVAPVAPIAPATTLAPKPTNPFATLSAAKAEAAARTPPLVISDDVLEEIVSRVMQRMSDSVVRETVTEIVSSTAERLVQEEIERIRTGS